MCKDIHNRLDLMKGTPTKSFISLLHANTNSKDCSYLLNFESLTRKATDWDWKNESKTNSTVIAITG